MTRRTLFAQVFGLVALAAALLALPQGAWAHAGHAHTMHASAAQASAETATTPADHDVAERHAEQTLSAAAQDAPGHLPTLPCERGCCAQSSCAACFSAVAPMPPQVAPPLLRTVIGLATDPQGSGIDGPSLRRPPRSLA